MSGRHLRRGPGSVLRVLLLSLVVLVVGAGAGAGGSLLLDERPDEARPDGAEGGGGTAGLEPDPGPITLALIGDIVPGWALADRLAGPTDDLLGPLSGAVRDADLAVANVDAPIAADPGGADVPAVPSGVLGALAAAGIDVVSMANDRSLDLGTAGLYEALAADEGIGTLVGIGADEDDAYRPFLREVGGHTVAVLAATQLLDPARIAADTAGPDQAGVASAKRVDRLVAEVAAARAVADTVVVYLHWGAAGERCPTTSQQELVSALVDAGADIVAGPGAGTVQGAGRTGASAVAYGLGAFVLDAAEDADTGVLLVEVDGREVLGLEWVPARRVAGVPEPLTGAGARAAVDDWEALRGCAGLDP